MSVDFLAAFKIKGSPNEGNQSFSNSICSAGRRLSQCSLDSFSLIISISLTILPFDLSTNFIILANGSMGCYLAIFLLRVIKSGPSISMPHYKNYIIAPFTLQMDKAKICRYFQNGKCRKDNCPYVHQKEYRKTCKYWKEGHCKSGDQCEFYHEDRRVPAPEQPKRQEKQQKPSQKPRVEEHQQPKPQTEVQLLKRQAINRILGIKEPKREFNQEPKQEQKQVQKPAPVINFTKQIVVNFMDLSKTPEGQDNIHRIQTEVFKQKPYLQYLKTLNNDRDKELAQVIRRYQYSFQKLNEDATQFSVRLCPLAPKREMKLNFPIGQRCLEIRVTSNNEVKVVLIVNDSIPNHFKEALNTKISLMAETKGVYEVLKYIENNFQQMCQQVDFLLQNRPTPLRRAEYLDVEVVREDQEVPQNDGDSEEDEQKPGKKQREIKPDTELGTLAMVQKLDMNCQILVVEDILLHLMCDCSNPITYILRSKKRRDLVVKARIRCPKCRQVLTIYMDRRMLSKSGEDLLLGLLGVLGGNVEDIGGVSWKIICSCQKFIYNEDLTLSGVRKQISCYTCFQQYNIQYYGIFKQHQFMGQAAQKQALKFDRAPEVGFKLDTELPNKGTCKHSKYSHRFFRFPCCGRAFACQKCHEEKTEPHKQGQRSQIMICGFCSCEQTLANVCKRCKKELVRGSDKAGHWEGGAGCRDKTMLSKNDSKKYSGLNKTTANKRKD